MERRKHQRFPVQFRSLFSSVNMVSGEGMVLDLSVRGCRVNSATVVRPGTNLMLRLSIPDFEPPIEIAVASVRGSQGEEFGLEFHDMKESEWKRFTEVINGLEQKARQ